MIMQNSLGKTQICEMVIDLHPTRSTLIFIKRGYIMNAIAGKVESKMSTVLIEHEASADAQAKSVRRRRIHVFSGIGLRRQKRRF